MTESAYNNLSRDGAGLSSTVDYLETDATYTPLEGDLVYLVKPETSDKCGDSGVFLYGEVVGPVLFGKIPIQINASSKSRLSENKYFRFETLNLKDPHLRRVESASRKEGILAHLGPNESVRLEILSLKTNMDFDEHDAMVCLLAYENSRLRGEKPESSQLTALAAVESGRLVTSVSSKMSNFRAIDPRAKGGLKNGAKIDKVVWDRYYIPETATIDINRLRMDIAARASNYPLVYVVEEEGEEECTPEIPNDKGEWQIFARRVRRGQSRFRKALLTLYDGRCAFTGVHEDSVLEACHIMSHAETGNNHLENGLLLRADIHTLFDLRLATVANDGLTIRISRDVTDPEFSRLDKTPQRRACISDQHRSILAIRNKEITWLS